MSMFDAIDMGEELNEDDFGSFTTEAEGLKAPRDATFCVGHDNIESHVLSLINSGNIPHALIFSGVEGIGKSTFAFRLARYLLKNGVGGSADGGLFGDTPPPATSLSINNKDPVFKQIASGGHPDFLFIHRPIDERKGTPKNNLDVDTARKTTPFLRKTASDGGWRVVLVDDADTMNRNAQNALLKILEEPPKNAILILICHRLGNMIPTIRSRCRVIHFDPLTSDTLSDLMQREIGESLPYEERQILSFLSDGSIGLAKTIIDTGGIETAQQIISILEQAPYDMTEIHNLSNSVNKDEAFKNIERFFLKMIEAVIFAKAQNQSIQTPLTGIKFDNDLAFWLQKYEAMKAHFSQAQFSNLDKKLATLNAFILFKE